MKKDHEAGHLVLPYLEAELQPKRIPTWLTMFLLAFILGALLFPFYS